VVKTFNLYNFVGAKWMGISHVKLTQVRNEDILVEYIVQSFDFNPLGEWEQIGRLLINKQEKTYEFLPSKIWTDYKAIPPSIFYLEKTERDLLLQTQYKDYGWELGALRIHHWATSFIDENFFPLQFPPVFSLDSEIEENRREISS
jgi:hypothetical protein